MCLALCSQTSTSLPAPVPLHLEATGMLTVIIPVDESRWVLAVSITDEGTKNSESLRDTLVTQRVWSHRM